MFIEITVHTTQNSPVQNKCNIKPGADLYIADLLSRQNHKKMM